MNWRRSPRNISASSTSSMAVLLHILTQPGDTLARQVIARQREQPEQQVVVFDLAVAEPDYAKLLEQIFAADSVAVW